MKLTDQLTFALTNAVLYANNFHLVRYYRRDRGRFPNIANPRLYSERMLWRKTMDRNPLFVVFSDKLAAKDFVQQRCPGLAVPRTLWVGSNAHQIPEDVLRGDVFVKANHGCDFNRRVRGACDRAALKTETDQWLASIYGRKYGEWAYSEVTPRLFVEEAVGDAAAGLIEFNVRASNGKAVLGSVIGRCKLPDQWVVYLDPAGVPTLGMKDKDGDPIKPLPPGLNLLEPYLRAVEYSRRLSTGVDYARFDFMWNGSVLYAGEVTTYPARGTTDPANKFTREKTIGGWDLLQSHFLKSAHTGWKRIYAGALIRQLKSTKR